MHRHGKRAVGDELRVAAQKAVHAEPLLKVDHIETQRIGMLTLVLLDIEYPDLFVLMVHAIALRQHRQSHVLSIWRPTDLIDQSRIDKADSIVDIHSVLCTR